MIASLRQLNRATLARQLLLEREQLPVLRALDKLLAIQAQWPKPPFIALWSRLTGFAAADLSRVLHDRKAVRATLMRCTIHLCSAADYLAFRPVLQPVLTRAMQSALRDRAAGLDSEKLVTGARRYFGSRPCTFAELREALAEQNPKADERAMGYMVRTHLPLVQVPTGDRWGFPATADFALADAWLKKPLAAGGGNPAPLVLRYLAALGPATVADAQAFTGLMGLRAVFEALRPKLISLRDEHGRELFDLPKAPRPPEDTPAPVRFLPEFDNVIVSRAEARFVPDRHRKKVFLSGLRVAPVFLVDGFAAGTWKLDGKKVKLSPFEPLSKVDGFAAGTWKLDGKKVKLSPFEPLSKKVRDQLEEEAEPLARFVG